MNGEEMRIIDNIPHRKVDSGYTIRQWFSHSTEERGPGPGWDNRISGLESIGIDPFTKPSELPDEPYYLWEPTDNKER